KDEEIEKWVRNWMTYYKVDGEDQEVTIPGGSGIDCKVFLLSVEEVDQYLKSDDLRVARDKDGAPVWWSLRSPGSNPNNAAAVSPSGWLDRSGDSVNDGSVGVRPALWLNP
ncbi:MAG: DUF6273 domain-containing protein, partial [Propionibacteriaceae bacterium]|nr:DUF6273 domain-containing protein [Propionibacteriaceae bacterium]